MAAPTSGRIEEARWIPQRCATTRSAWRARPVGLPTRADWRFTEEAVAEPEAGGVLVKTLALSLDPAMRGWMNEGKSYIAPVGIGDVMRAGGIGVVVASKNPAFAAGDTVSAMLNVQDYCLIPRGAHEGGRPLQDRPARRHARRNGSTCSACRA